MRELGKRALAITDGWHWMTGMSDGEGTCLCVDAESGTSRWAYDDWVTDWEKPDEASIPDFNDDATCGCLVRLVRDKHGCDEIHAHPMGDRDFNQIGEEFEDCKWIIWLYDGRYFVADSEVEALVVALEAPKSWQA